jgi:hypothetical protein
MILAALAEQRFALAAFAALFAVVYIASAWTIRGRSLIARCGVALVAIAAGALVTFGRIEPVVAYALICLSGVAVYIVDLVQEERARRRRVASLSPRARLNLIPSLWAIVAALSAALVAPYTLHEGNRFAAAVVALCTMAMAAISWRIASAPLALAGWCDIETERKAQRALRATKSGLASILAVGTVYVFASFANQAATGATPLEHSVNSVAFFVWIGLGAWVALYVIFAFLPARRAA